MFGDRPDYRVCRPTARSVAAAIRGRHLQGGISVTFIVRRWSVGSRGNAVDRRTLIIGEGISLSGEVTSCDRLIVEGTIEAKLEKCQHVIIAETGVFNGNASTENADVRGRFQGELVVRKRLLIRAGGHVSGTITYGEVEIESGGKISGAIQEIGAADVVPNLRLERLAEGAAQDEVASG